MRGSRSQNGKYQSRSPRCGPDSAAKQRTPRAGKLPLRGQDEAALQERKLQTLIKRRLSGSLDLASTPESCWREDSQINAQEVAHDATAPRKPFHSSRSIPNPQRKHPSAFHAAL